MAENEHSGFFNAVLTPDGYDKVYDAADFAEYFSKLVKNGVFFKPEGQLQVVAKSGLTVTVKAGSAYINGYYYVLEEDKEITFSPNVGGYRTLNTVSCILNYGNREITIEKKEGMESALPVNDGSVAELTLASFYLEVGAAIIANADITDHRPDEMYCGFVTSLIDNAGAVNAIDTLGVITQAGGTVPMQTLLDHIMRSFLVGCSAIAAAVTSKGVQTAENASPETIAENIGKIDTAIPLTGNAVAADVIKGKTFYNTDQTSKITGTMPVQNILTDGKKYLTQKEQTFDAGYYARFIVDATNIYNEARLLGLMASAFTNPSFPFSLGGAAIDNSFVLDVNNFDGLEDTSKWLRIAYVVDYPSKPDEVFKVRFMAYQNKTTTSTGIKIWESHGTDGGFETKAGLLRYEVFNVQLYKIATYGRYVRIVPISPYAFGNLTGYVTYGN